MITIRDVAEEFARKSGDSMDTALTVVTAQAARLGVDTGGVVRAPDLDLGDTAERVREVCLSAADWESQGASRYGPGTGPL
ncbi:hypothetical protein AB0I28_12935 [Phytomonospora sp. NPDC050363]|uniref:hypothetical protein n=1 Tax=Phytomonospora sp. NPDC050363 TaxID=3155642 RepID=UPI0033C238E6